MVVVDFFSDSNANMTKPCRICGEVKPFSAYHKNKLAKTGYDSLCKTCNKARVYEYRKNNPDAHRRAAAAYRKRNPDAVRKLLQEWHAKNPKYEEARYKRRRQDLVQVEKMRAANQRRKARNRAACSVENTLTTEQVFWFRAQCCSYCMAQATELDHVVPISCGGANSIDNVVPACRKCNAKKGAKSLLQFLLARKLAAHGAADGIY